MQTHNGHDTMAPRTPDETDARTREVARQIGCPAVPEVAEAVLAAQSDRDALWARVPIGEPTASDGYAVLGGVERTLRALAPALQRLAERVAELEETVAILD